MSTPRHARPAESSIRLSVWRPVALLAVLGTAVPAVFISQARGEPLAASAPDVTAEERGGERRV